MTRILLGQLGANGDCLYATILARQIRQDHPDAHITWAISSQCVGLLRGNPHIDAVWKVDIGDWSEHEAMWFRFEEESVRRLLRHEFDHAYLSQIWPNNFQNFDGTVRPSILRSYGGPITVPIDSVIELDAQEQEHVRRFVKESEIERFEHRVLFECSSKSGQSFVTPDLAQDVAERLYAVLPDTCVIFSTHLPMTLRHPNSVYAGGVSLRETAALTEVATLVVGCGSGGTVVATSTAAARRPMIQLLRPEQSVFASFAHDFEYFGLSSDHMLEMTDERPQRIADCIASACRDGLATAKATYGEAIPVTFGFYASMIDGTLLSRERYLDAAQSVRVTAERYGWQPDLLTFARNQVAPRLAQDRGWRFPHRRRTGEEFIELVAAADGADGAEFLRRCCEGPPRESAFAIAAVASPSGEPKRIGTPPRKRSRLRKFTKKARNYLFRLN